MTRTTVRTQFQKTEDTELTHIFRDGQKLDFEDNYDHYIHAGAIKGVDKITIENLKNAKIYFLSPLVGFAVYEGSYRSDSGVVNFVNCENVTVEGLVAENSNQFRPGNMVIESSCVINVMSSSVKFVDCAFTSHGKIAVSVHSNATVEIYDSVITGHYFELFNGASSLTVERCQINQASPDPDSHAMLWVSSSQRESIWDTLHENGNTILRDNTFWFRSGRGIVSGNGSYHTRSTVFLARNELLREAGAPDTFGICIWNENYQSITVEFGHDTLPPIEDYIETPATGIAKFVNYSGLSLDDVRPGGPNQESPIIVAGVSSETLV